MMSRLTPGKAAWVVGDGCGAAGRTMLCSAHLLRRFARSVGREAFETHVEKICGEELYAWLVVGYLATREARKCDAVSLCSPADGGHSNRYACNTR